MIFGYIRVSTNSQTTENQKLNICKYLQIRSISDTPIWISENVSGTKQPEKRLLGDLLQWVDSGDMIIVTELSRLGRSLMMILKVLEELMNKDVKVISLKENYELGNNIQSKVLAFAFGLSAEIERNLISERTKMGLERARAQGKQLGRRKGQKVRLKLEGDLDLIKERLKEGISKLRLSRELNCSSMTLSSFMNLHHLRAVTQDIYCHKKRAIISEE